MSKNSTTTRTHIRSSFRDAIYTNLNIGLVESYVVAFMLTLGVPAVLAGMGTVLPQFIGVMFQLLSIRSVFRKYALKARLQFFLALQALTMIPLILIGWYRINSAWIIFSILSIYWASLLSLNPPWNRLMGHTIPGRFRLNFFSIRSQFAQFSIFLGLITSGLLLDWARNQRMEADFFVVIMMCGLILKCLSWYEVTYHHMGYLLPAGAEPRLPLRTFITRLKGTDQGRLAGFLFFFYIGVYFSAPYYTPYMLTKLKFSYLEFMAVTGMSYLSRVIMFKLLQKRAKPRHINKLLIISTVAITSSPLCWALSQNHVWIMGIEFMSGCYWAAFELSTLLLYYQKIEDHERTSILTYLTLFNTSGMIIGSSLGALFMQILPPQYDKYIMVFAVSAFLRLLTIIFAPHVNFKGQIPKLIESYRTVGLKPALGQMMRPIVGKIRKDEDKS